MDSKNWSEEELNNLTCVRLIELLREKGLNVSGIKKELVERILVSELQKDKSSITTKKQELNGLTVVKLREILRQNGLRVSGLKSELIDRLIERESLDEEKSRIDQVLVSNSINTIPISEFEVVVLDLETSGFSPKVERVIEASAVILRGEDVISTFSSLCNPDRAVGQKVTELTGISNEMLQGADTNGTVMLGLHEFIGNRPIICHNASFDKRFLEMEMKKIGKSISNEFLCTLLLARRLVVSEEGHSLQALKEIVGFAGGCSHKDHRALADVQVTVAVWLFLQNIVRENIYGNPRVIDFSFFQMLSRIPKNNVARLLPNFR